MKKLLAMLLVGLMLISMMSTAAFALDLPDISEYAPEDGVTFYALVIDTTIGKTGNYGLQLCALNINDINHRGLYTATVKSDTELLNADGEITAEDISMGDIIALTYSGEVEESYPGNVLGVTRVYVVDHVETLGEIESLIPDWCDDNGDYFPSWNVFASIPESLDYSVSDGKVTLSWRNTSDETYTVYWKRSSSDEWKVAGTTSKHKVNITGLKNGISYDFKVEILGQDSEIVTATPTDDIDFMALPAVDCFGNGIAYDNRGVVAVSASDITNTQLTVTLTNNGDVDVNFDGTYLLQEYKDGEWSFVHTDYTSLDSTLELFTATANGGSTSTLDRWTTLYGELPAGHYRLIQYYYYETADGKANAYGVCGFDIQ
ncbi:MAG: fibronectin type III domain-containing protein [Oscillospiraceae bacterium]|nr:fibronectin type III domain-containing protein [Oscillospiraceae bacterium]